VDFRDDEGGPVDLAESGSTNSDNAATMALRSAPTIAASVADPEMSLGTPRVAMGVLEARRSRTFAVGLAALCVVASIVVVFLGGDRVAQRLQIAANAITAVVAGTFAVIWRDHTRYRSWGMSVISAVAMLSNATGFYYWGPFSAFVAACTIAGYIHASNTDSKAMLMVFGAMATLIYTGIGIAEVTGLIPERGLFIASPVTSHVAEIGALVMFQAIMAVAVMGGVDTRVQMKRILDEHHAATHKLAQRDAQLAEAREAVRAARGPGEGRYTGELLGRFRLGIVLGRGAMGEVYAATDDHGEVCAVKVLAAHLLQDESAVRRFQREARAIAGLNAPNIVRMLEVSPVGASQPYIAMELLEGDDLAKLVERRPVRELAEVVEIVRAVAAGLDAAHAAGVVHRDLKPANIFAATSAASRVWKILDFGVSKIDAVDTTMTMGNVVGTPGYMAPEQARGDAIDHRVDIYSLGIVVYRLLTGRPAVMPGDSPQMLHEVVFRVPPRPRDFATLSPHVEAALAIAIAKNPRDRYATASEFATALAEAAQGVESKAITDRAAAILRRSPWGQWMQAQPGAMA
jgi:serine/threonine-protein kinase